MLPTAPVLATISNPDGDGEYVVGWTDVTGATSYQLEEAEDPEFTSPTVIYDGSASKYRVSGQGEGTWYYRVRARSPAGDSPWSNIESVEVWSDAPALASISNPDGVGDYLVARSEVTGATSRELQEADNSDLTSSAVPYTGASSQFQVYGQGTGRWYYRVRASSAGGDGPWSNTEWVGTLASMATPFRVYLRLVLHSSAGSP